MLDSAENYFYCFSTAKLKGVKEFVSYKEHTGVSSDLYISKCHRFLFKVERCKYNYKHNMFRWFFRDLIRKFFILGLDARREYKGYNIVKSAGLNAPSVYFWGGSISPLNNALSFLMIDYKSKTTSGLEYFRSLTDNEKRIFIRRLANEAVRLSKYGFVHRDFHLNNFLIEDDGRILWIDTHLRKLSIFKNKRWKQITSSLCEQKLESQEYKDIVLSIFKDSR